MKQKLFCNYKGCPIESCDRHHKHIGDIKGWVYGANFSKHCRKYKVYKLYEELKGSESDET